MWNRRAIRHRRYDLKFIAKRIRSIETLEQRCLLAAEGVALDLSEVVDTSGLLAPITSQIRWDDGSEDPVQTIVPADNTSGLKFTFDYRFDTGASAFFNTEAKKDVLENAGRMLLNRIDDQLDAIVPSGNNTWAASFFHPVTGVPEAIDNLSVAENEILVFVGARDLPGDQRGLGGPGGFGASGSQVWVDAVRSRGQSGAVGTTQSEAAPWGGSIVFDNDDSTDWFFGEDASSMTFNQRDFLTFATHELAHVLGIGHQPAPPAESAWQLAVSGNNFIGSAATDVYGGSVPLEPGDLGHWLEGITSDGRDVLFDPILDVQTRVLMTPLDFAGLEDIGWEINSSEVTVSAGHTYADNGEYTAEIVLRDAAGNQRIETVQLSVDNTPPTLSVPSEQTVFIGQSISLLAMIEDPGFAVAGSGTASQETFSVQVDWKDGAPVQQQSAVITRLGSPGVTTLAEASLTHVYESPGTYDVEVTVQDDDLGTRTEQTRITVSQRTGLVADFTQLEHVEGQGEDSIELVIRRPSSDLENALPVSISTTGEAQFEIPTEVEIPANRSSISVLITTIDNAFRQNMDFYSFQVDAVGYQATTGEILLLDDDNPFQNSGDRFNVTGDSNLSARDALVVINNLNRDDGLIELRELTNNGDIPFYDVNGDYRVSAVDALNIINELNRENSGPEPLSVVSGVDDVMQDWDDSTRLFKERVGTVLSSSAMLF